MLLDNTIIPLDFGFFTSEIDIIIYKIMLNMLLNDTPNNSSCFFLFVFLLLLFFEGMGFVLFFSVVCLFVYCFNLKNPTIHISVVEK